MVTFHLSGLGGMASQFLNGTPKLSELVLSRSALPIDQSRSVFPLRSANARELIWRLVAGKCTRTRWSFLLNWPELFLFGRPDRTNGKRLKKA